MTGCGCAPGAGGRGAVGGFRWSWCTGGLGCATTEYLTLSWFTDHADRDRAWDWALASARTLRPINYAMNAQLNAAKKAEPLESRVDELRKLLPPGAVALSQASRRVRVPRSVSRGLGWICCWTTVPSSQASSVSAASGGSSWPAASS